MKKIIFCNLDLLKLNFDPEDYQDLDLSNFNYDCLKDKRNLFLKFFKELSEGTDNLIYFYSRKSNLLTQAEQTFHEKGYNNFHFRNRNALTDFVMSNKNRNNYFVFIGGKNADFKLAVNTRSLYIVPTWLPLEDSLMYCLSSFTTSSKSVMLLRPLTCHIPVSPGLVARRAR